MRPLPQADLPWDPYSDQPAVITDRRLRRQLRRGTWPELLKQVGTAVGCLPLWCWHGLRLRETPRRVADLAGVAISPMPDQGQALAELVDELGVRRLAIRCPLRDPAARAAVWRCLELFPEQDVLLVVPQDRVAVCDPDAAARELETVVGELPAQVSTVQLGNAVNRLKWGCAAMDEYLRLSAALTPVLRQRQDIAIAGSAVIDFEPLATLRSLVNGYRPDWDICSALLYVDRRGAPQNAQYRIFDTRRKIHCLAAALRLSRVPDRLWLTEVNWPLSGTAPYAPTSEAECVDEESAARYLVDYLRIAAATGLVERVYVWQLVAKGYGLVDPDGLRRRPAFHGLRQILAGDPADPGG